jgi:hypothetical protein
VKRFRAQPPSPPRGVLAPDEWQAVVAEAKRQADSFYPYLGDVEHRATIAACEKGIERLVLKGVVRIRRGRLFYWHGYKHAFLIYTAEVNEYFLALMRPYTGMRVVLGPPASWMH